MSSEQGEKPGSLTAATTTPAHSTQLSRWPLIVEARVWRGLMRIGMTMHKLARPRPASPAFTLHIPATLSPRKGRIRLVFYVPDGYESGRHQRWPVIVNFHGGGFTLGEPTDDARWASAVVHDAGAVCVSVGYRRAPEYPFPTAVEDGADAILWLLDHADEFSLDADRLGVSGFSAGGNMALTVPLLLQDALLRRDTSVKDETATQAERRHNVVKLVVAWYPPVDVTRSRDERRASCVRPDKTLPAVFTTLFDKSYLWPPGDVSLDSPYLSPGIADDELLKLLPHELFVYTCEWDQLWDEGETFRTRMQSMGKHVGGRVIEAVEHAWDKGPNPLHPDPVAQEMYTEACREIRRIFNHSDIQDSNDIVQTVSSPASLS